MRIAQPSLRQANEAALTTYEDRHVAFAADGGTLTVASGNVISMWIRPA